MVHLSDLTAAIVSVMAHFYERGSVQPYTSNTKDGHETETIFVLMDPYEGLHRPLFVVP